MSRIITAECPGVNCTDRPPPPSCRQLGSTVLDPLKLAESTCPKIISYGNMGITKDPFKQTYRDIEQLLELALANPEDAIKEGSIARMHELFEDIDGYGDILNRGRAVYHAKAERLKIFLPAFTDRMFFGVLRVETVEAVHDRLVDWLSTFDETYRPDKSVLAHRANESVRHIKTESEIAALLTRIGGANSQYFPYPASEREEASNNKKEIMICM